MGPVHRGTSAVILKQQPARSPRKQARFRQAWLKAFIWAFIGVFLLGSVGAVALIAFH
jgi:hypothetical protein